MVWGVCLLAAVVSAADPGALYRKMIPEDKHLDSAWVESLTERGHPLDAAIRGSKAEDSLEYIGMPVAGIACGTLVKHESGISADFDAPLSVAAGQSLEVVIRNMR